MLYIITYTLKAYHYMAKTISTEKIHLVEAASAQEAEDKLIAYYTAQDREYDVSYMINIHEVTEKL